MKYCEFINYKGKRILRLNINTKTIDQFEEMLQESSNIIRKEPPGTVLSLAAGGADTPIFTNRDLFIDYLKGNEPYMKASVVSGLDKLKASIFLTIVTSTGRQLMLTASEDEAREWLVSQV